MRVLSDEELKEGREEYEERRDNWQPRYWRLPKEVALALAKELNDNPDAVEIQLMPYWHKDEARLAARAVNEDGGACGQTYDDIRPCPPFCE